MTGNAEMFEAINAAYESLSDPQLRTIFDKLKGVGQEDSDPKFSGVEFFDALGREAILRAAILCVLYDRRLHQDRGAEPVDAAHRRSSWRPRPRS